MPTDIAIAQSATLRPISAVAAELGLDPAQLFAFGPHMAKIPLEAVPTANPASGKLVLVSAISPTPAGEGKTTTSIGLAMGLARLGQRSIAVLREPSLGPVFGLKGGAAGGGYAQVVPMEAINLHFTGDFSAIEKANNLLAAMIDNNLQVKGAKNLGIDPRTITWKRVMDMNDRALRQLVIGLGGTNGGIPRESGFNITAASEVMAILCLANDRADIKRRLGNIFIGFNHQQEPVYARDLQADGAMTVLLKQAIQPNLVQTLEGTPALLHGGPFANIAQGTNSVMATRMGLALGDYVVTEAGFGFDLGAEKFLHIKCRTAELFPAAVVIVATVRALKYHGGVALKDLAQTDPAAVARGCANLEKHLENAKLLGLEAIVAINRFDQDQESELAEIRRCCQALGVTAVTCEAWARGGAGAVDLAEAVLTATAGPLRPFQPLFAENAPVVEKINLLATKFYGAGNVNYSAKALSDLKRIEKIGLGNAAVCMAKTQYSFSDNPTLLGRPTGFELTIREIEVAAGAGFVVPITGEIMRMPGLPGTPAAVNMDLDEAGNIIGLA